MTKDEMKRLLARVQVSWDTVFDEVKLDIYAEGLADLSFESALMAVKYLTQSTRFVPRVAEIREVALESQGKTFKNSIEALALVNKLISDFGFYKQVEGMEWLKTKDETVYNIIKAIGYRNYCMGDANFMQGEFLRLYKEFQTKQTAKMLVSARIQNEIEMKKNQLELKD